jgi:hypothetical protein
MSYQEFRCPHCEKAVRVYDPETLERERQLADAAHCRQQELLTAVLGAFTAIEGVRPGRRDEDERHHPIYDDCLHLHAEGVMREAGELPAIAEATIRSFRMQIAEALMPPESYQKPHIWGGGMVSCWALSVDGYPSRLILSYQPIYQGYLISLDVYRKPA